MELASREMLPTESYPKCKQCIQLCFTWNADPICSTCSGYLMSTHHWELLGDPGTLTNGGNLLENWRSSTLNSLITLPSLRQPCTWPPSSVSSLDTQAHKHSRHTSTQAPRGTDWHTHTHRHTSTQVYRLTLSHTQAHKSSGVQTDTHPPTHTGTQALRGTDWHPHNGHSISFHRLVWVRCNLNHSFYATQSVLG